MLEIYQFRYIIFSYEVLRLNFTLNSFVKLSVVSDDVTIRTSVKTKFILRFDETSFVKILLGVTPSWDYMPGKKNISQKVVNISPNGKIHSKGDRITGSILNGLREPVFFVFTLDYAHGYKMF